MKHLKKKWRKRTKGSKEKSTTKKAEAPPPPSIVHLEYIYIFYYQYTYMTLQINEYINNMKIYDTPDNSDKPLIDGDINPLP